MVSSQIVVCVVAGFANFVEEPADFARYDAVVLQAAQQVNLPFVRRSVYADPGRHRLGHALRELAKFQEAGIRVIGEVTLGKQAQSFKLLVVGLELRKIAWLTNTGHAFPLSQLVPDAPADAVLTQAALLHQGPEMLLERVAIAVDKPNRLAHGDAPILARELDNLQ